MVEEGRVLVGGLYGGVSERGGLGVGVDVESVEEVVDLGGDGGGCDDGSAILASVESPGHQFALMC